MADIDITPDEGNDFDNLSPEKRIIYDIVNRYIKGQPLDIDPDIIFSILYNKSSDLSLLDKYYYIPMVMFIIKAEIDRLTVNHAIVNRRLL